ncbi:MAG TPA: stage 0 sporulation family protein [bacterium]|nr:stage 0 sporulation family protein [bacterium]
MIETVEILVRGNTFTELHDTQRIPLKAGDFCMVESPIGIQMGKVISDTRVMKARCVEKKLPKVIRKASDNDLEILKSIEDLEADATRFCQQRLQELGLAMKLVKVIFAFDRSKGLFMFTADGRVDFRELVRDLAQSYKTRIEMRQIGIRDEARLLGGIGNCGNPLCCVTFLRDFHPVSIKMAKDQGLSLIPSKISGICGRLMCCLQYEHHFYAEQVRAMPKIGKRVMTPKGEGRIRQLNILKGLVLVDLAEGEMEEFAASDVIPYHQYLEDQAAEIEENGGETESSDGDEDSIREKPAGGEAAAQAPDTAKSSETSNQPETGELRKSSGRSRRSRRQRRSGPRGPQNSQTPRSDDAGRNSS